MECAIYIYNTTLLHPNLAVLCFCLTMSQFDEFGQHIFCHKTQQEVLTSQHLKVMS